MVRHELHGHPVKLAPGPTNMGDVPDIVTTAQLGASISYSQLQQVPLCI